MGSAAFKQDLIKDHKQLLAQPSLKEAAFREVKELLWAGALKVAMRKLGKTEADIQGDIKSAPWKIAIAAQIKSKSTVSNVWLAEQLHMGTPAGVSRYITEFRQGQRKTAKSFAGRIANIMV